MNNELMRQMHAAKTAYQTNSDIGLSEELTEAVHKMGVRGGASEEDVLKIIEPLGWSVYEKPTKSVWVIGGPDATKRKLKDALGMEGHQLLEPMKGKK